MMDVTPDRLKEEQKKGSKVTIIDLQDAHAYEHAHVPGAVNIPMDQFEGEYAKVLHDKDAIVVAYGEYDELGKGTRAAEILAAAGFQKLGHIVGGLKGWQEKGYPTEGGRES